MRRGRHAGEEGQILVMVAATLSLLLVPLSVFVIDSALVESSYAELSEALQSSAEDGASEIDQNVYYQSGGQRAVLDPIAARSTAGQALAASQLQGLHDWSVAVSGNTVTTTAYVTIQLLVVPPVTLHATRSATFVVGT